MKILRLLLSAALAVLVASTSAAPASGGLDFVFSGGMPPASERVQDGVQRIWKIGEFSALRLSRLQDASLANDLPAALEPAALQSMLQTIQCEAAPGVWKPLFAAPDLPEIALALARALALGSAQDDVTLLASARYDGALLGLPRSVLARIFVQQGALNILVGDARADLLSGYKASNILPAYDFGDRQRVSASKIRAAGSRQVRSDWLALELAPVSALPSSTILSVPARSAAEAIAQRLENLKYLLDKGLISNTEYQQKRTEILQAL